MIAYWVYECDVRLQIPNPKRTVEEIERKSEKCNQSATKLTF